MARTLCIFALVLAHTCTHVTGDDHLPPRDWRAAISTQDMLYTESEATVAPAHMPAIGNGFLATQIMADFVFVSGLFNGRSTVDPSHRAGIPSPVAMAPLVGDGGYVSALDLRRGTFLRRNRITPAPDATPGYAPCRQADVAAGGPSCATTVRPVLVEQRWYAHQELRSVLVHEVSLLGQEGEERMSVDQASDAEVGPEVYVSGVIIPRLRFGHRPAVLARFQNLKAGVQSPDLTLMDVTAKYVRTFPGEAGALFTLFAGRTHTPETPQLQPIDVVLVRSTAPEDGVLSIAHEGDAHAFLTVVRVSLELEPEGTVPTVESSLSVVDRLVWAAVRAFREAYKRALLGTLWSSHEAAWSSLWQSAVELDTSNTRVNAIAKSSLYSLSSFLRSDWPFGSSPGGLSTNGYNGHQFWDYDTFSAPIMMLLQPRLAESVFLYRVDRVPGARAKARSYNAGYAGAMIPWEAALSGEETCPSWAPTGQHEIHITGDVALSVWQYFQLTHSVEWLERIGFPILEAIADFWVSRAIADTPGARVRGWQVDGDRVDDATSGPAWNTPLHIRGVIPPTEFYHNVSDSVFTNAVAMLSLEAAAAAVSAIQDASPHVLDSATIRRAEAWRDTANRIVIPFDAATDVRVGGKLVRGLHPYFAGYRWGDKVQCLDALMLWWPGGITPSSPWAHRAHMTREVFERDLAYYVENQDSAGSVAFAWDINAIMYAEAGDLNKAAQFFHRAYDQFVYGPFMVWMEGSGGWGVSNFVTGAGGFLESLVFGFARVRFHDAALCIRPALPPDTRSMKLKGLHYRGNVLDVEFNSDEIQFAIRSSSADNGVGAESDSSNRTGRLEAAPYNPRDPETTVAEVFMRLRPWLRDRTVNVSPTPLKLCLAADERVPRSVGDSNSTCTWVPAAGTYSYRNSWQVCLLGA